MRAKRVYAKGVRRKQRLLILGHICGALLTQSCSLRSGTLTPTYRRSLISSLKGVINAFINRQLVPAPRKEPRPLTLILFAVAQKPIYLRADDGR